MQDCYEHFVKSLQKPRENFGRITMLLGGFFPPH